MGVSGGRGRLAPDEVQMVLTVLGDAPLVMWADRAPTADRPRRFLVSPNVVRVLGDRPTDVDGLYALLETAIADGQRDLLLAHRDATRDRQPATIDLEARVRPFAPGDGGGAAGAPPLRWMRLTTRTPEPGLLVGYLADIDDAVLAQRAEAIARAEAEASRDRAVQANRAKSEFLSRMSHELRTPLNSIVGFGQLLELQDLDEPEGSWCAQVVRAGHHLLTLIDEILDVATIETGRMSLSLEPVDAADAAEEAIGAVAGAAAEADVAVLWERPPSPRWVHADRRRVVQVLVHVLENAIRYGRLGGMVEVRVDLLDDERVGMAVLDRGPGIGPDDVRRAFQPFERLGAEHSSVEGTGMGLSLAGALAERMGGSLSLTPRPAGGTIATLVLPGSSPPVAAADHGAPSAAPTASSSGLTALYIEDNVANLRLMEHLLELRPAVTLVTAMRGRLGIDIAREQLPDLVLVDLHLPDLDGREVITRLREDPRTRGLTIAVISADAAHQVADEVRRLGADYFFTKPIDIHEVIAVVDRHLERAGRRG